LRVYSNFLALKDVLLITPPFTQLNTPYPATAYIKGFLNTKGIESFQIDLGIEVILELFTKKNLAHIFDQANKNNTATSENAVRIASLWNDYLATIEPVINFLQGKNQTLARLIASENFLPQASRFEMLDDMDWAFGAMGMQDKAKHLATLYLEDLSDFVVECIDPFFGFSRYAERLGRSANSFDELHSTLQNEATFIDSLTLRLIRERMETVQPKLVCFSVPFPGNLYSAFRCAQYLKTNFPGVKIAMGGGFPNTELRSVSDVRVFEYFDYIALDDGELPLELILSNVLRPTAENTDIGTYKRTFMLEGGKVVYKNNTIRADYKQGVVGTPDYSDLPLDQYISVIEIANPMHSLWSDGRWNKLTMAHGCYWGKCTFCDVSLDYIKLYEPIAAKTLVDRMEAMIVQTGERGFHFVDEAAPPALMREVALEILRRNLVVTWWTNIRFEKSFTYDLCQLLKASGCIAVSGGLEVASDRLLALIDKGVTVEQVAQVNRHFTEAGIMVHAYLMYGYPTQTIQETIDSLEMVRQMFELNIMQSGFWHQFALTAHSPVGLNPDDYGIKPNYKAITFANNDVEFVDSTGIDHEQFSYGLKKSLFNYMHGMCFDFPLQKWFDFKIPRTSIPKDYIAQCLDIDDFQQTKATSKIIWLGGIPQVQEITKSKKGNKWVMWQLSFHTRFSSFQIALDKPEAEWLVGAFDRLAVTQKRPITFTELKADFETHLPNFELFWYSKPLVSLRENGLLAV
jgi:hypothetical protein